MARPRKSETPSATSLQSSELAAPRKRGSKKTAFQKIEEGLTEAVDIAKGKRKPAKVKTPPDANIDGIADGVAAEAAPKKKRAPDWEAIEREYRVGQLSVREIGRMFQITDTAIRKKAKAEFWVRDLSDQVRVAAKDAAVRAAVRKELSREPDSEAEVVKTFGARGARAIEGHLSRAERIKALADKLATELETYMAGGVPSVQIFVSRADSPATIIRTLSDTVERIAKIERIALNLDDAPSGAFNGSGEGGGVEKTVIVLPSNGR